jgi:FkbM family methyltransferase
MPVSRHSQIAASPSPDPVWNLVIPRTGIRRLFRELVLLRNWYNQLIRVMPFTSAINVMLHRGAPVVGATLKATSSVCYLRRWSSDLECLKKVFVDEEYRLPFDLMPRIIVDAGANIGAASIYFAKRYPTATILALEPEASNFALLRKNCLHLPQVIPVQAALWPQPAMLTVADSEAEKWAFTVRPRLGEEAVVRGITVDDLMREFSVDRIDLLKLDIEGAEKELFGHAPAEWLRHVSVIAIELHDRFSAGCAEALYSALYGRKFRQEVRGETIFIQLMQSPSDLKGQSQIPPGPECTAPARSG